MAELPDWTAPAPLVVNARFVVPRADADAFSEEMQAVANLLAGLPGCSAIELGRAVDDPTLWTLTSSWRSVGDYRRALSSYEVKLRAVPMLSTAIDEPTAFEVLYARRGDTVTSHTSARAADADTVGLGDVGRRQTHQ